MLPQSTGNELTRGTPALSALSFIGGVHIGARALPVLNLIWFSYIARLSQWDKRAMRFAYRKSEPNVVLACSPCRLNAHTFNKRNLKILNPNDTIFTLMWIRIPQNEGDPFCGLG